MSFPAIRGALRSLRARTAATLVTLAVFQPGQPADAQGGSAIPETPSSKTRTIGGESSSPGKFARRKSPNGQRAAESIRAAEETEERQPGLALPAHGSPGEPQAAAPIHGPLTGPQLDFPKRGSLDGSRTDPLIHGPLTGTQPDSPSRGSPEGSKPDSIGFQTGPRKYPIQTTPDAFAASVTSGTARLAAKAPLTATSAALTPTGSLPGQPAGPPAPFDSPPPADSPEPRFLPSDSLIHSSLPEPKNSGDGVQSRLPSSLSQSSGSPSRFQILSSIPMVSYGAPSWAIKPGRSPSAGLTRNASPPSPVGAGAAPSGQLKTGPSSAALSQPVVPVFTGRGVELDKREDEPSATLNMRILVSQNFRPADTVMVYPYPVKPPKLVTVHSPLPDKPEALRNMLLATGYRDRIDLRRPYPLFGWRWVHAFTEAKRRSGLGYPHSFITMYPWLHKIMPYVIEEVQKSNKVEEDRLDRYRKAVDDFERNHVESESEATRKGLYPVAVKLNSHGVGQVSLPEGQWWVSALRAMPGLKLYWQVPFSVSGAQVVNVQLTEANSLVIQGGW